MHLSHLSCLLGHHRPGNVRIDLNDQHYVAHCRKCKAAIVPVGGGRWVVDTPQAA